MCPNVSCHSGNDLVTFNESEVSGVFRKKSLPAVSIGNCVVPEERMLPSFAKITAAPFNMAA